MKTGRHSILTRLGRIFQKIHPIFFRCIELPFSKRKIKSYPMIFVITAPRSGSTLTYQILTKGTKSLYLSNLSNLLYALPLIGGLLSKNKESGDGFKSNRGWVDGLFGQSEGMRFWEYWIGQSLEEPTLNVPSSRIIYLQKVLGRLITKDSPMISAYLGHAFSINKLREIFPGATFIYLKRDKLSNIYSLFNIIKTKPWFSLKPISWQTKDNLNSYQKAIWQYNSIISSIERDVLDEDTLVVNYEDICIDPHNFLNKVKSFVVNRGVNLQLALENIPKSFIVSRTDKNKNEDTEILNKLMHNE